jgi:ClpP class serine protease
VTKVTVDAALVSPHDDGDSSFCISHNDVGGGFQVGIYAEYLDKHFNFEQLSAERKAQLKRISELRGRDVLVFAADLKNNRQPIGINYSDLLPLNDQLSNLSGTAIDIILETPGGSGETVEDMVKLLRGGRYESMAVIVPGAAKSAGTIFAMAADEILMEPASALGPIDAQITWQGKIFSAHALLEGMNKIKQEVVDSGALNRAYIPILQNISPGELQHAQNAYDFARDLVADWLVRYKFRDWTVHQATGQPVTPEQRAERARQIADELRNHGKWKTHGRSIKIEDLRVMKLRITDYSENAELCDAIRRYHTLLQMTFDTNVFKIFETPTSQIMRLEAIKNVAVPGVGGAAQQLESAEIGLQCGKCKTDMRLHAAFKPGVPVPSGSIRFPADNRLKCPGCGTEHDLSDARRQIEAQSGKPIVA